MAKLQRTAARIDTETRKLDGGKKHLLRALSSLDINSLQKNINNNTKV